jgi:hypothetical protein
LKPREEGGRQLVKVEDRKKTAASKRQSLISKILTKPDQAQHRIVCLTLQITFFFLNLQNLNCFHE